MTNWERPRPVQPNPHEPCGLTVLAFLSLIGLAGVAVALIWRKLR